MLIKRKYMVMSRVQNAGRSRSIKIDKSSFEWVEGFRFLGKILTNQNSVQVEIKSRLKSGNACCRLVQNLISSSLLSKNLEIQMYRNFAFFKIHGTVHRSMTSSNNQRDAA